MIRLAEDAPFSSLILKTSVKNFHPALGASLIVDFSGNHNKKLKIIFHFLAFLKTVQKYNRTSKRTSFWAITNRFGLAQQDRIGLEASANLYA